MEHHDHSLAADIETMLNMTANRRQSLRWLFAGAAPLPMAGCDGGSSVASTAATTTTRRPPVRRAPRAP